MVLKSYLSGKVCFIMFDHGFTPLIGGLNANLHLFLHIYKMQKICSLQTSHEDECRESQADSPSAPSKICSVFGALRGSILKSSLLFLVVVMLVSSGNALRLHPTHEQDLQISSPSNFDFLVFCPATEDDVKPYQGANDTRRFRVELNPNQKGRYLPGRTYIIRAESKLLNGKLVLQYCGRLRTFNQYCNESVYACTSGPMFDIEARKSIDVIWINNLNSSTQVSADKAKGTCMDPTFEPHEGYCSLKCKTRETMTFDDPTIHPDTGSQEMRISYKTWPISTHVHGGEVRPAFDGNPLSWHVNDPTLKEYGLGMFSLSEKCYFDSFEKQEEELDPPIVKLRNQKGQAMFNFKVNRYPNKQNPGTLWYHDHAMRITNFNVQYGLAGFYILRDTNVENYLGIARFNEKFVLITSRGDQKYDLTGLVGGTVYRFRFLNANYEGRATFRYSFSYNKCDKTNPDLETFTVIGADSSLFDHGIENQQHFVISNGERIDLIIKLSAEKESFSICGDTDIDSVSTPALVTKSGTILDEKGEMSVYNIKAITLRAYDQNLDQNTRTDINNIDLSEWVAYEDLSKMSDEQIAVKRYRPLMGVGTTDTINGRIDFHAGFSENPVIGTTEDWFLINTFPYGHPMHIHLINYQVIKIFQLLLLKTGTATCSFYEIDYVLKALETASDEEEGVSDIKAKVYGVDENGAETVDYNYTCNNLNTIKTNHGVLKQLSFIYPENEIDENRVSGLDLFAKDESDLYKYVIEGEGYTSPKVGYSKWKDTVYIDGYKILQCRLRWTKPEYKEEVDKESGTYFHVPADQMREYPGFVYHCHILPHEDNEMMRPIMLQMPDDGRQMKSPCPQLKWEDKVECINKRCENAVKA